MTTLSASLLVLGLYWATTIVSGQTDGDLRLVGANGIVSSTLTSGRLQVRLHNDWGDICSTGFDIQAADVACHQLGFTEAISVNEETWNISSGTDEPFLNFDCPRNDYLHLFRCNPSAGICTEQKYVTVECDPTRIWNDPYPGQIRLSRGTSASNGLVEVYCNGKWGTVCDDGFDKPEADTICKQLGYTEADRFNHLRIEGTSIQPIWMANIMCPSTEPECLRTCQRCPTQALHVCGHYEDVTIQCKFTPLKHKYNSTQSTCEVDEIKPGKVGVGEIRLVDGETESSGIVELFYKSEWRRICSTRITRFINAIPRTACRQLGYIGVSDFSSRPYSGNVSQLFIGTASTEWHILRTSSSIVLDGNCSSSLYVTCSDSGTPYSGQVRLRGGQYPSQGRVEVYLLGRWGALCTIQIYVLERRQTLNIAMSDQAICRQLGYTGSIAASSGTIPEKDTDPVFVLDLYCTTSSNCFGNCYNNHQYSDPLRHCPDNHTLVVNCTYDEDISQEFSSGDEFICSRDITTSSPPTPFSLPNWRPVAGAVVGSVVFVAIVISVIAVVFVVVFTRCGKKGRVTWPIVPPTMPVQAPLIPIQQQQQKQQQQQQQQAGDYEKQPIPD